MKKHISILLCLLLLCLFLAGCEIKVQDETLASVTRYAPTDGPVETGTAAPTEPGEEELPDLNAPMRMISGPAGRVYAVSYFGASCRDEVYGDVDGDGRTELLYCSAKADGGEIYEAIIVYGLEEGWPVQKGSLVLGIGSASTQLKEDGGRVCYSYQNKTLGDEKPVLLPLCMEGDFLWFDAELPESLEIVGKAAVFYGRSFRDLKKQVRGQVLVADETYFLWKEPGGVYRGEDLEAQGLQSFVSAAVTSNGVTVTGVVYWSTASGGSRSCTADGILTPTVVKNPESLVGKTEQQLIDKLGDPCFERCRGDSSVALCWFTADGKLLTVQTEEKAVSASLTDLPVN